MASNEYVNPYARPDLVPKSEEFVREHHSDIADDYLTPYPHPELPGYLLDNAGMDGTPVRVRVLRGTIHEPDGTPRKPGDVMIMPKYVADQWLEEKRLERA